MGRARETWRPRRSTQSCWSSTAQTRAFFDYEAVSLMLDGVCQLFESELKKRNPQQRNITYDISDLHSFIDELGDCGCMVYEAEIQGYRPYNKDWIKAKVLKHLQRQA